MGRALPTCISELRRSVSDLRMDAYRTSSEEDDLDLLARYVWNMALGAALHTPLQCLEVALRNALHDALTARYLTPRWYEIRAAFRSDEHYEMAQTAVRKLRDRADPDAPGRVVAALEFGFWTRLLSRHYASPSSSRTGWRRMWPELVPVVFPGFPDPTGTVRGQERLYTRFDNIRRLRNRVSQHEPIWKGRIDQPTRQLVPLDAQYEEVLEALSWINPAFSAAARVLDARPGQFPDVWKAGPGVFRNILATLP